jgi:molybdopterin synthase catalytic subunit
LIRAHFGISFSNTLTAADQSSEHLKRMANPVCEVLLTEKELDSLEKGPDFSAGAIADFSGVIRDVENGREIEGIEYEAHRPMAEHQLGMIGQEAARKFGLQLVVIHHRLGFVPAGESSLLLRVASRHRTEAFQASQWIVDELKRKVPIWKHPRFKTDHQPRPKSAEIERDLVSRE